MKITLLKNGEIFHTQDFQDGSWKIGREAGCDLVLESSKVSKQHALLVIKDGKAAIMDNGSSNGVYVNGILVKRQRIHWGDEVQIGEFVLKLSQQGRVPASRQAIADSDGNAALKMDYEPIPEASPVGSPQEKLLGMVDKNILSPFYEVIRSVDWRYVLASILGVALVGSVILSAIPIIRWGKNTTLKETLRRAHTAVSQTVRENYRILSKTNETSRLTVEACEAEQGIIECFVIDPQSVTVLAPTKQFNLSVTDPFALLAIKSIKDKQENVSIPKNDTEYVIAQPIYLFSPDTNDKGLTAIVLATFRIPDSITSTFEPVVEALLFAVLLSLVAYFFIFKMIQYPIVQMEKQLDLALKGEGQAIRAEVKLAEMENLAQVMNFSLARIQQGGGGNLALGSGGPEDAEDAAYLKAIEEFDYNSSDALLVLDAEKKVELVGKVLEELLSLRNQYARGQNISDACKDAAFAGTAIDLAEQVINSLGEAQSAQLDINGTNRQVGAVAHKNSKGEIRYILVTIKMA